MSVIATETQHYSNVVKYELWAEKGFCKKLVTLNGAVSTGLPIGAVLGSYIASATGTAAAMVGTGNATAGTITATADTNLQQGAYTVKMTAATTFNVFDTKGTLIGAGVNGSAFTQNGLSFIITAGATPAVAGDTIAITVAGTVKYKLNEVTATDGTQVPRVVVVGDANGRPVSQAVVVNTDTTFLVMYRGPAAVADASLTFGASVTAGAVRTAALAALTAASNIDVLAQS